MKTTLTSEQASLIVRLAWEDRTSFEEIRERTGLVESQVIDIMRRELTPSSFRCWRKRVRGRATKHHMLLELRLKGWPQHSRATDSLHLAERVAPIAAWLTYHSCQVIYCHPGDSESLS